MIFITYKQNKKCENIKIKQQSSDFEVISEVLGEPDFKPCFSIFLLFSEKEVVLGVG